MTLDLDPDRRLALAYVPSRVRPALEALWRLDVTFAAILAAGRDPTASRLRLAWWREALEGLDAREPPAEPLLRSLAGHVLPGGISGAELAAMAEGWEILLTDRPLTAHEQARYAALRGGLLFDFSARLLGAPDFPVAPSGALWALVDLARHSSGREELRFPPAWPQGRWPRALRPLGMLAALARRDSDRPGGPWESQGNPARMLRMVRHRLTGY
ncbi:MAG TPA: squalene/phytoene synthase family protein [Allosphingosinicella sp.]|jgi:phytoene synthase|nr:squalene/phytoene synthase family protein [Allosphingosinicella sp.]